MWNSKMMIHKELYNRGSFYRGPTTSNLYESWVISLYISWMLFDYFLLPCIRKFLGRHHFKWRPACKYITNLHRCRNRITGMFNVSNNPEWSLIFIPSQLTCQWKLLHNSNYRTKKMTTDIISFILKIISFF